MSEPVVNAESVLQFLGRLGQGYRRPGVVYLVGGSSLLLVAAKLRTADIDLQFEVPDEYHIEFIRCLRQLSREMGMPVEQASPGEFMPLPAGFESRRRFIGRFGSIDVYHLDFYSVALAKIQRGNEKDFADVVMMVRKNVIEVDRLDRFAEEVTPRIEDFGLRASRRDFERKFAVLKQRLAEKNA